MPTILQDEFLLTTEDYHRMIDAGTLQIGVYTQPAADGYAEQAVYHIDDQIALPYADVEVSLRDLLA